MPTTLLCVGGGGSLLNLLQDLLQNIEYSILCFGFLVARYMGLAPPPGTESPPRALYWKAVLTIGPPEKSLCLRLLILVCIFHSGKSPLKSKKSLMLLKDSWSHFIYIYIYIYMYRLYVLLIYSVSLLHTNKFHSKSTFVSPICS